MTHLTSISTPYQYTSSHALSSNPPYQYTLSTYPINIPNQHTLTHKRANRTHLTYPINTPYPHPINPPSHIPSHPPFLPVHFFSFLFFSSIVCPFLAGVADAVHRIQDSGARVMMITGDSQDTATSIARSAGIYDPHRWVIVTNLTLSHAAVTHLH